MAAGCVCLPRVPGQLRRAGRGGQPLLGRKALHPHRSGQNLCSLHVRLTLSALAIALCRISRPGALTPRFASSVAAVRRIVGCWLPCRGGRRGQGGGGEAARQTRCTPPRTTTRRATTAPSLQQATTAAMARPMRSPSPAAVAAGAHAVKTPAPIIDPAPMTTASRKVSVRCRSFTGTRRFARRAERTGSASQ